MLTVQFARGKSGFSTHYVCTNVFAMLPLRKASQMMAGK